MAETKTYTYKAKDGIDRFLPGIGQSKGGIIVTDQTFENPNFELVPEVKAEVVPEQKAEVPTTPAEVPATPSQPITSPAKENA